MSAHTLEARDVDDVAMLAATAYAWGVGVFDDAEHVAELVRDGARPLGLTGASVNENVPAVKGREPWRLGAIELVDPQRELDGHAARVEVERASRRRRPPVERGDRFTREHLLGGK